MKATLIKIEDRVSVKPSKTEGILSYDVDNAYPQRIRALINASSTGTSCAELYAKFIRGKGMKDTSFYKLVVNEEGTTVDKLLRALSKDFAKHGAYCLHLNYNAQYKISEVNLIPYEYVRFAEPDDHGYINQVAIYDDWNRKKKSQIRKKDIDFISIFNPDPIIIQAQVDAAGGWEEYKGQVKVCNLSGMKEYSLSPFDSVLEDLHTDSQIKTYKLRSVTTDFMASHLFVHKGEFASDKEKKAFISELEHFQGADNAGKIFMVEAEEENQIPTITPFLNPNKDTVYQYTEKSVKENIIQAMNQPVVLLGIQTAGKLGTADEIIDAYRYYNAITEDERISIEEVFKEVFFYWHEAANPSQDFSIVPLQAPPKDVVQTPAP